MSKYRKSKAAKELYQHTRPNVATTRNGDVWILGSHRLMCGDSTKKEDAEKLMNGDKAELCFTSPPYEEQKTYDKKLDLSSAYLSGFLNAFADSVNYFAVNLGLVFKDGAVVTYWDDHIKRADKLGFKLLAWNIWNKSGYGYSIGRFSKMFALEHEFVFVFGKERKELNKIIPAGEINERKMGSVYHYSNHIDNLFSHPAAFNIKLPTEYIKAMTNKGDNVVEPFCGSGTTIMACEKTGRNCFAMEYSNDYCDMIIDRWQLETGEKAVLEETGQIYNELTNHAYKEKK